MILDTNILLSDPKNVLYAFAPNKGKQHRNTVIIPMGVVYELDNFKDERDDDGNLTERSYKSREVLNQLKTLQNGSSLDKGIKLADNYSLKSSFKIEEALGLTRDEMLTRKKTDSRLIKICDYIKDKKKKVELITFDTAMQIHASSMGIKANDWKDFVDKRQVKNPYKGWREITLENTLAEQFKKGKALDPKDLGLENLLPNEYLIFNWNNAGRFDVKSNRIVPLYNYFNRKHKQIEAKNAQQMCFMDANLDPKIDVVVGIGPAGSGKSYISTYSGCDQVFFQGETDKGRGLTKILVTRPIIGHRGESELGFLPGTKEEKVAPWEQPIRDQFDSIFEKLGKNERERADFLEDYEFQDIRTLRGRSLASRFWIVTEGQNISIDGYDTILTRPGEHTKLIIEGDPTQTDLKNLPSKLNPLLYINEMLKTSPKVATVYFDERHVVRGPIPKLYLKLKTEFEDRNRR